MSGDTLGVQLTFNHHLRGDTGVVGTHLPQGVFALHTVVANEGVHDRLLKAVAHVQKAGDVGRWNHYAVGLALALRREIAFAFPFLVERLFDVGVSFALLVLAIPLVAIFAVLVRLESKGPSFFRQTRVGQFGAHFDILKLRSMRVDAEQNGAQWASVRDPRVTRVGRIIRT